MFSLIITFFMVVFFIYILVFYVWFILTSLADFKDSYKMLFIPPLILSFIITLIFSITSSHKDGEIKNIAYVANDGTSYIGSSLDNNKEYTSFILENDKQYSLAPQYVSIVEDSKDSIPYAVYHSDNEIKVGNIVILNKGFYEVHIPEGSTIAHEELTLDNTKKINDTSIKDIEKPDYKKRSNSN